MGLTSRKILLALLKDCIVIEILQTLFHEEGLVFQGAIPEVLAVIVGPAYESLSDFCPSILECSLTQE